MASDATTGSVLKSWVQNRCSWKEQTVLLCALRGPDSGGSPEVKLMVRWIRSVVLNNAAPRKTFMGDTGMRSAATLAEDKPLALDMLPVHFLGHLMHAFQVIATRSDDWFDMGMARQQYTELCEYLHLQPESDDDMSARLKDEV